MRPTPIKLALFVGVLVVLISLAQRTAPFVPIAWAATRNVSPCTAFGDPNNPRVGDAQMRDGTTNQDRVITDYDAYVTYTEKRDQFARLIQIPLRGPTRMVPTGSGWQVFLRPGQPFHQCVVNQLVSINDVILSELGKVVCSSDIPERRT